MEALTRMFTPSDSDGSGMVSPAAPAPTPQAQANTETGAIQDVGSIEAQSAQRRLARLSKYFTSPTGVLDAPTGSAGIF